MTGIGLRGETGVMTPIKNNLFFNDSYFYSQITKSGKITCVRVPNVVQSVEIFHNGVLACDEYFIKKEGNGECVQIMKLWKKFNLF